MPSAPVIWRVLGVLALTCSAPLAMADDLLASLSVTLAAGDTQGVLLTIRSHKDPADQPKIAGWIKQKVDSGEAPAQFAQAMIGIAMRAGNRDDALMYLDYFREIVMIDSALCPDPSSGGSLIEGTIFMFGRLIYDKSVTVEQKQHAVKRAMDLEKATAPERRRDPAICASGMTAYAKDLNLSPPGQPASKQAAKPPTALYRDDPTWRKNRDEQLPKLEKYLLVMSGIEDKR